MKSLSRLKRYWHTVNSTSFDSNQVHLLAPLGRMWTICTTSWLAYERVSVALYARWSKYLLHPLRLERCEQDPIEYRELKEDKRKSAFFFVRWRIIPSLSTFFLNVALNSRHCRSGRTWSAIERTCGSLMFNPFVQTNWSTKMKLLTKPMSNIRSASSNTK